MKKIIVLLIMLMAVSVGAETTSKYGSMWKQNDSTLSPADDITYVDFTGYTTVGVSGGGGASGNFVSYTTVAGSTYANITTDAIVNGKIIGGIKSSATGTNAGVFGGYSNTASGDTSFIGAGHNNSASDESAFVGAGHANNAIGNHSVIVGGSGNTVNNILGFIGGGLNSLASGSQYATIVGGKDHIASGDISFIGGGADNTASVQYATIVGGNSNTASGLYSFIGAGKSNIVTGEASSIAGGELISVTGSFSGVPGGLSNSVGGDYAFATGRSATLSAAADRTFADAYGTAAVNITQPDAHIIYGSAGFEKNVGIQVLAPDDTLDVDGTAQITGNTTLDSNLIVGGGITFSGITTVNAVYSSSSNIYAVLANATTAAYTVTLPDTSTVGRGFHHRTKKIDASVNAVTLDGFGSQTIDHSLTKIIRAHNNAITVVSDGTNWEVVQATGTNFYGDMHVHGNISTTVINTQDIPHAVRQFNEEDSFGMSFSEGSIGAITAFSEYSTVVSGTTKVTSASNTLTTGDYVTINGTTSYNGVFLVTTIDASNYYIVDTFVADDATGSWQEGDYFDFDPGTAGEYKIDFHAYGKPDAATNQDYKFAIYVNDTVQDNIEAKRRFANANDTGTFGGGGLATIADGDRLFFTVVPLNGTQDFTIEHVNVVIHLIRPN